MAIQPHELRYVEGDTLPSMQGTLTNDDGTAVDLADTVVTVHIKYDPPLVKTATITDAAAGEFLLMWEPTDLISGKWTYEIQLADLSGGIRTINRFPATDKLLTLLIDPQIA